MSRASRCSWSSRTRTSRSRSRIAATSSRPAGSCSRARPRISARTRGSARRIWAASLQHVKELLPDIDRWQARGEKVAIATVIATRRSSPRPVGSKLAVSENGELAGSVSGGCVESDVVLAAQEVLAGAAPRLITYGITDDMALEVGLPCGAEVGVFVEPLQ